MKFAVIVFPGSNCDHDCYYALKHALKQDVEFVWHKEASLSHYDAIILPGGFSYGDYLRTGAIARFSPVMRAVVEFANAGGIVVGICNGFQVLCEAGLLPGALMRNDSLKFVCKFVNLRVENSDTAFTTLCGPGEILNIPVAHAEGLYYADSVTLESVKRNNQVLFRYTDESGEPNSESNPNGSLDNIAGVMNERGNVMGMMPHPDRCFEEVLTSTDGAKIFGSMVEWLSERT